MKKTLTTVLVAALGISASSAFAFGFNSDSGPSWNNSRGGNFDMPWNNGGWNKGFNRGWNSNNRGGNGNMPWNNNSMPWNGNNNSMPWNGNNNSMPWNGPMNFDTNRPFNWNNNRGYNPNYRGMPPQGMPQYMPNDAPPPPAQYAPEAPVR